MRTRLVSALVLGMCIIHMHAEANVAVPQGKYPRMTSEQAIVIWDDKKKIEHFIRKPSFEGDPASFGFFVATPVTPAAGKVDSEVFGRMRNLVEVSGPRKKRIIHLGALPTP